MRILELPVNFEGSLWAYNGLGIESHYPGRVIGNKNIIVLTYANNNFIKHGNYYFRRIFRTRVEMI